MFPSSDPTPPPNVLLTRGATLFLPAPMFCNLLANASLLALEAASSLDVAITASVSVFAILLGTSGPESDLRFVANAAAGPGVVVGG